MTCVMLRLGYVLKYRHCSRSKFINMNVRAYVILLEKKRKLIPTSTSYSFSISIPCLKLELAIFVIRYCWLDEINASPIHPTKLYVELEVPTIRPCTLECYTYKDGSSRICARITKMTSKQFLLGNCGRIFYLLTKVRSSNQSKMFEPMRMNMNMQPIMLSPRWFHSWPSLTLVGDKLICRRSETPPLPLHFLTL